jgi:hypothetical protein
MCGDMADICPLTRSSAQRAPLLSKGADQEGSFFRKATQLIFLLTRGSKGIILIMSVVWVLRQFTPFPYYYILIPTMTDKVT